MHHSSLKLISCDVTIILVVSLSGGNMMKLDAFEMLQPQKTLMTTVVQHSQHFMIRLDSLMECPQNPLNCNGHDPCIETVLKPHQRCPAKQGMENHEESKESRDESRESPAERSSRPSVLVSKRRRLLAFGRPLPSHPFPWRRNAMSGRPPSRSPFRYVPPSHPSRASLLVQGQSVLGIR